MLQHGITGADFRACRELCGWPQEACATDMGVNVHTIKMWETPKSRWEPRPEAWAWMDRELQWHESEVARVLDVVDDYRTLNPDMTSATLVLFRPNDGLGRMRGDSRPSHVHNAIMREVWQFLNEEGLTTHFVWASQYDADPEKYKDAIW